MRPALAIAAKDLRQRVRDRSAIVLGFVAPLVIAAVISFAFKGIDTFHADVGLVDGDRGPVAAAFEAVLRDPHVAKVLHVTPLPSADAARAKVKDGRLATAYVIPAGFSAAVTAGGAVPPIQVLTSADGRIAGDVARSIADSFAARLNADRLGVATALAAGADPRRTSALAATATGLDLPEQAVDRPSGTRPVSAVSYYAPAMAIFFVFFAVSFSARSYFSEQRDGTLDRIAAAPVRPVEVLAGKAASVFVYGLTSMAVVAIVTSAAFGARWGSPVGVAALCVAMALVVVCLSAFVITVARTDRQADGLASIVIFGLTLAGGNFVTLAAAPALLRRLALFTPNGWALRAFTDMSAGASTVTAVMEPLAAIGVFCLVVGAIAAARARAAVVG